jgi:ABC-type iron transport system FetAB permease component
MPGYGHSHHLQSRTDDASTIYSLQGMFKDMAVGLLVPAALTVAYLLLVVVQPDEWYDPQYAIPLMGMLLGNALNGVTIGVKAFLELLSSERSHIEWALCMGATRFEAVWCGPFFLQHACHTDFCGTALACAHRLKAAGPP